MMRSKMETHLFQDRAVTCRCAVTHGADALTLRRRESEGRYKQTPTATDVQSFAVSLANLSVGGTVFLSSELGLLFKRTEINR